MPDDPTDEGEAARRNAERQLHAARDELTPQMKKSAAQLKIDKLRDQTDTEKGIAGGNPGNNPEPQPPR